MTDSPSTSAEAPDVDPDAIKFAEVASGIYRRFDAQLVWTALRFAVRNQLFAENPAIMLMFVRIAEVYPEAGKLLQEQLPNAEGADRQAIDLIVNPPQEIRNAAYLPDSIQSPGEMDLCWAEFLVTGKTDAVEKLVDVLDREDLTRTFLQQQLSDATCNLELSDEERMSLQQFGIGLGRMSEEGAWEVMTPGDTDLFLWLGVKDQDPVCTRIMQAMDDSLQLHLANKGAALWSLKANASQHGAIRLLCDAASKSAGGFGRTLIAT